MITYERGKYRIILASGSPRRQKILKEAGIDYDIVLKEYEETFPKGLNGEEIARYVAREKASCFRKEISEGEIVITADTVVWCNGRVLGKPVNREEAVSMLTEISGNTHEVITGVSIMTTLDEVVFSETTKVTFNQLTEEEISFYIDNFKPYDKAGAYGIQEWIGIIACSRIEGSYFNVVGLPVQRLYRELQALMMNHARE